jgi:hypothetical protein
MGFDPQETLTHHDETRYVQDGVGIQIMELNPVGKKKTAEEFMRGERRARGGRRQGKVSGIPQVDWG